jgi:Flp pilus assembly protein TadD
MTGESLFGPVPEGRALYGETWLPRLHYGWSELASLVDARFHFIDGPDPELYDLAADPAETRNLIAVERRARASMTKALASMRTPLEPPGPADDETRRSLAALGYLGTAAVAEGEALPDPKTMLATLVTLEQGLELFAQKNPEGAVPLLRRATKENPRMVDAWDYLGRSYQRLGRQAEALEAFGQAMALSGGQPELALDLARALVEAGRPEEAAAVLIDQARKTPQDLRLGYLAVRVELLLGRVDAARTRAQDLVRRAPQDADASYALGSVAMASRELELAERALRRALELRPEHPAALNDLGVLLAAQKRGAEARLLFERLARLQPDNESARRGLSALAVQ